MRATGKFSIWIAVPGWNPSCFPECEVELPRITLDFVFSIVIFSFNKFCAKILNSFN
jgi:hypothetical protein